MKRVVLAFVLAACSRQGPELDAQQVHRPEGSAAVIDAASDSGAPLDAGTLAGDAATDAR